MIWDDPWILIATRGLSVGDDRFNTYLPPPLPTLPPNIAFCCLRFRDLVRLGLANQWIELVGTKWGAEALVERLEAAWVPILIRQTRDYNDLIGTRGFDHTCPSGQGESNELGLGLKTLVGTCVLWRKPDDVWILETLHAVSGYGTNLMRSCMTWIWHTGQQGRPFILSYTWELTGAQLLMAWWRGWLTAASHIQYGWVLSRDPSVCGFCPSSPAIQTTVGATLPQLLHSNEGSAIVNDSGRGDGWGHVCVWAGSPDWKAVCERGNWSYLWAHSQWAPPGVGWRWTGEFVVVGAINDARGTAPRAWVTAEV